MTTDYRKAWRAAYRRAKKARGECRECTQPVAPGRTRCQYHLDKTKGNVRHNYAIKVALGICAKCSEPAEPEKTLCPRHLDSAADSTRRKRQRRAAFARS